MSGDQLDCGKKRKMKRESSTGEKGKDREGTGLGGLSRGWSTNELAFTPQ